MVFVAEYSDTPKPSAQWKGLSRLRRHWHRISFDCKDVDDLRAKVSSTVVVLGGIVQNQMRNEMRRGLVNIQKHCDEQARQDFLDWIIPRGISAEHTAKQSRVLHDRMKNTGSWLLHKDEWKLWVNSPSACALYCHGIPGAGKTFLFSMLVEQLQILAAGNPEMAVAFFFCSYERLNDDETIIAKVCLRMLLDQVPMLVASLKEKYEPFRTAGRALGVEDVFVMLEIALSLIPRGIILIDALDELPSEARDSLLLRLYDLQKGTTLRLLFTTRPRNEISQFFPRILKVEIRATEEDVEEYVCGNVTKLDGIVRKNTDLQNEIVTAIKAAVDGM